jgi:hypothetical protein
MGRTLAHAALATCLGGALGACGAVVGERSGDPGTASLFENRAWVDTDPRAAPGSLRTWASGGTLVMASCAETPRIAAWRWTGTATLAWEEDGVAIPAEIAAVGPDALVLLIVLASGEETRRYRLAEPGPVC